MIKNAIIEKATISNDDHGLLTAWIMLDYGDGGHQGFGGFALYLPENSYRKSGDCTGKFIFRCLQIAGVTNWEKLNGRTIRVDCEPLGEIKAIGHIVKEDWFCPKTDLV